jgi:hypothetical protein
LYQNGAATPVAAGIFSDGTTMVFPAIFSTNSATSSSKSSAWVLQAKFSIIPVRQEEFFRLFFPLKNKSVRLKKYEQQVDKVTQH